MLRVLLVIEDYNELVYLQALLMKLGFDIDGVQSHKKTGEKILEFNPQVIISSHGGPRVDGCDVASQVKKRNGLPKVFILRHGNASFKLTAELKSAGIDLILDSPVNPKQLLIALATAGDIDIDQLTTKYEKIKQTLTKESNARASNGSAATSESSDSDSESQGVKDGISASEPEFSHHLLKSKNGQSDEERKKRYQQFIKKVNIDPAKSLQSDDVLSATQKIRSQKHTTELEDLDRIKRQFVKSLFDPEQG